MKLKANLKYAYYIDKGPNILWYDLALKGDSKYTSKELK